MIMGLFSDSLNLGYRFSLFCMMLWSVRIIFVLGCKIPNYYRDYSQHSTFLTFVELCCNLAKHAA